MVPRQTKRRWSWNQKAVKCDEEAGTYQALVLSREVWRASSGATILLRGAEGKDCEHLDAVMRELEPLKKERHGWRDECVKSA